MKQRENYRSAILDQMESAIELLGPNHSLLREMQARDGKLQKLYAELDEIGVGIGGFLGIGAAGCVASRLLPLFGIPLHWLDLPSNLPDARRGCLSRV